MKKSLTVGAMVLSIGSAVAQVLITPPTLPTTPITPTVPSYPAEATTCPLPRKLHQKPKSFQNWTGLYQDRVVVKLMDDVPLAPTWTAKGPAFKELTPGGVKPAELDALNQLLAGTERGLARQHASVPVDTLTKWRAAGQARSCEALADLGQYYRLYLAKGEKLETVVNALNASPLVEIAFLPPIPQGALDLAPATPDFQPQQRYLGLPSSGGIGAREAWRIDGARGAGVRVIDVESTWNVNHEDIPKPFWAAVIPTVNEIATALQAPLMSIDADVHHGTAVVGELVAFDDKSGVTGVASDAEWGASSVIRILPVFNNNNFFAGPFGGTHEAVVADAILDGQEHVRRGDAILIEQHSPGPESCPFGTDCGQRGYVPMEFYADVFDAIKQVTALGTIVVEAAGNGTVNLDAAIYEGRFDRKVRDSGAILVGATSGEVLTVAGALIRPNGSSNSGSRLDVSAWGANVMTTGYGTSRSSSGIEVNGPNDPNQFYTPVFGGTSSASPLVTGAVLSVQGVMIASEHGIVTPKQMRDLLTRTGQLQQASLFARPIGPLVNLDAALRTFDIGTAPAGGMGGSEFTLRCPAGLALIGIKGKAGWLIDRVQAICGTLEGAVQSTDAAGGAGGTVFERTCDAGKVVVGLGGRAGAFVDSLEVQCDLPPDGQRRLVDALPRAGGPFGAVFGPEFCPRGRVGVGLKGRASAFVDRVQLLCAVTDLSPLTSWTSNSVGGSNGSYANLKCNTGEVLVGVRASGNWFVDRLQARCVQVSTSGAWVGAVVTRGTVGGTGGTEELIQCPNGSAVSGISGNAYAVIDRLRVYCRDLTGPLRVAGAGALEGIVGGTGGEPFGHIDCPSDLPARGFDAWGGAYVDRLELVCGTGL